VGCNPPIAFTARGVVLTTCLTRERSEDSATSARKKKVEVVHAS
jgi:hypothetical protein